MVKVDPADLSAAMDAGFREDSAEKVLRLLGILRELETRKETKGKFPLKGGTALNIFHLEDVPRLSVDIDLIAAGFPRADPGTDERASVIKLVEDIVKGLGYKIQKSDSEDSGCTIRCNYRNTLDANDQIKIDLDFVGRQTLMPVELCPGPAMFLADDFKYPVLAPAELFAQKIVAVAYRAHARDLYDMHRMLAKGWHELPRAREMYLAHSFLKDHEWYRLGYPAKLEVPYDPSQLEDVLRGDEKAPSLTTLRDQAQAALVPHFSVATPADQDNRAALLKGDRLALARIAGEKDAKRAKQLAESPALAWRLQQAARAPRP